MKTNHNHSLDTAIKHWQYLAPIIHEPQNDRDYKKLSAFLDQLLDKIADDEKHPLMGLVDVVSYMIDSYDNRDNKTIASSPIEALKFLMQEHNLKQSDLSDIASQGVLSEILNEKRQLNLRQVKQLAKKFNVSSATFIDTE